MLQSSALKGEQTILLVLLIDRPFRCSHDASVLRDSAVYQQWPEWWMLFDAGMTTVVNKVISPYRGVAYHLSEITRGEQPMTKEELFNLRHAVKRSGAIECAFGLLKNRFQILRKGIVARQTISHKIVLVRFDPARAYI